MLSALTEYQNAIPLPSTKVSSDCKSFVNPESSILSKAYDEFVDPIDKKNNGFDFHVKQHRDDIDYQHHDTRGMQVYCMQSVPEQIQYARELYERIQCEFSDCRQPRFRNRALTKQEIRRNHRARLSPTSESYTSRSNGLK
jgi:hypothetical protein